MRYKFFQVLLLLFLLARTIFSSAACGPSSTLNVTQEKIIGYQKINSRNDDDFLYAFSFESEDKETDPYRTIVLSSTCSKIFEYRSGDFPFSLFTLSDTSEAIFSLSTSGSALVMNVFYIDQNNVVSHAFNAHSRNPPSFRFTKSASMPLIVLDDNKKKHRSYRFDYQKKIYIQMK